MKPAAAAAFPLYIPEYYTPPRLAAGEGAPWRQRQWARLLWSWLRDARSPWCDPHRSHRTGDLHKSTWALMGEDTDTPNLARILDSVRTAGTSIPQNCC